MSEDQCSLTVRIVDLLNGRERGSPFGPKEKQLTTAQPDNNDGCDFCFVLGAPAAYSVRGDHYVTLFLDPAGSRRALEAGCFQIRGDRPCDAHELVIWADQIMAALCGVFLDVPKIPCIDLADLRVVLHNAKGRSMIARAYQFGTFNTEAKRVLAGQRFQSAFAVLSVKKQDFSPELFSQISSALEQNLDDEALLAVGVNYHQHPSTRLLVLSDD